MRPLLAGERVLVTAEVAPRPDDAPWLLTRHVVGRLTTDAVAGQPPTTSGSGGGGGGGAGVIWIHGDLTGTKISPAPTKG